LAVCLQRGCAIFADEGGETVNRNRNLNAYFTRGRGAGHLIHICAHHHSDLLPKQRDQLGTLFLFLASPSSADGWADEWSEERLKEAATLAQYEFLWCEKFGDKETRRHRVTHGMFPYFQEEKWDRSAM